MYKIVILAFSVISNPFKRTLHHKRVNVSIELNCRDDIYHRIGSTPRIQEENIPQSTSIVSNKYKD